MTLTDESDERPKGRLLPDGWEVISNPSRKPEAQDEELKKLIQDQQRRSESTRLKKHRKPEPPEAA